MPIVEFFFDIISPFSRIQCELLLRQTHWKSMQLKMTPVIIRKIFEEADNTPPALNPTKARYLFRDLKMISEYSKIPYKLPDNFLEIAAEFGTKPTQLFLTLIQEDLKDDDYNKLVAKFFFHFFHPTNSVHVGETENIKKIALECGISADVVEKAIKNMNDDKNQLKLKKNIETAVNLGAFGLPVTLVHNDSEKPAWVFGSDRMHIIGHLLGEKEPPILR